MAPSDFKATSLIGLGIALRGSKDLLERLTGGRRPAERKSIKR
jgi:hypothetical protein